MARAVLRGAMTDLRADAAPPTGTLARDLPRVAALALALAWFSREVESPALAGAAICWAVPALAAWLATTTRRRWGWLALAACAGMGAGLALGGEAIRPALGRAVAYAVEVLVAAGVGRAALARLRGAATPLTFGFVLAGVALLPPLAGATIAAALGLPETIPAVALGTRWAAVYSADSYALLAMFPFALAMRRNPLTGVEARGAVKAAALTVLVAGVTIGASALLPRPFAFCSLVLGTAALVVGPRTRYLLVWICLASAACFASHFGRSVQTSLRDVQLLLFLPGMAIALPILVLSVALQRLHQSTDVLERSRERYRQLYDKAPVMLQSLDEHGRTTEVNAQWLAAFGVDGAEVVRGVPFDHFVAPEDSDIGADGATAPPSWHQRLLAARDGKLHVRLRTAGGRTLHALASAASTPEDNDARGAVIAFEDISVELAMRAEIERERDQLAALTSATSDLAVFLDRDLRYRLVNRAFEQRWEIARDRVLGRHPRDVPGQAFFAGVAAAPLARALAGEGSHFQALVDFPRGQRVMEVALAPAFDAAGDRAGVVATMHDVTERVGAQQELQRMVEALQHANEGLEQFARIASHDLREPLNTITQFAGLIAEDHADQLPPDAARYFALMGKAAHRMKGLLDDVLQFARLERTPHFALETVSLDRVFVDLHALLHARLTTTGCALDVAMPLPAVLGQTGLVELLFQNLLTNAMRYTAPGIAPVIDVTAETVGDLVVVTVADNGVGIPSAELERVFEPFHKLRTWQQAEGSGLGLAICRRIATAFGGRVWAESENGRGTRLHVALRAAGPSDAAGAAGR